MLPIIVESEQKAAAEIVDYMKVFPYDNLVIAFSKSLEYTYCNGDWNRFQSSKITGHVPEQ